MTVAHPGMAEFCRFHAAPSLNVAACGKSLAFAGQDRNPHTVIRFHPITGGRQFLQKLNIKRIELFWPPDRHDRNVVLDIDINSFSHVKPPAFAQAFAAIQARSAGHGTVPHPSS